MAGQLSVAGCTLPAAVRKSSGPGVALFGPIILAPVLAGLLAGVAGSLALTRVLGSLLFGVGAGDPATIGGVTLVLTGMAVIAILTPARRAMRVQPSMALRDD